MSSQESSVSKDSAYFTGRSYQYLLAGNQGKKSRYVCLQQNPFTLVFLLFFYGKPLGFRGRGLRLALDGLLQLFYCFWKLSFYQFQRRDAEVTLELPVFGHLCLKVNKGYKVLDLRRNTVVKIYSPKEDLNMIAREINLVRRVGEHDLAPTVRRWNLEERWYEEDYVNAYRADGSTRKKFSRTNQAIIVPLIERMILTSSLQRISAWEYVLAQRHLIHGNESKLSNQQLDSTKVRKIRAFLDEIIQRLETAVKYQIFLTFTHGDFSLSHVLVKGNAGILIDWEAGEQRSALYDVHNFFFASMGNGPAWEGMAVDLETGIFQLQTRLARHSFSGIREISSSFSFFEVYRLVFIFEKICKELKFRRLTDSVLDNNFLKYINAFTRFEDTFPVGPCETSLESQLIRQERAE